MSAGPPLGGLYLKPASSGGLCEGVTTIPSARCAWRPRLYVRMAHEMTGVGVTPASRWMMVSTLFAASTSRAVRWAGSDRRSEEHTSELQSHSNISYAVFC